MSKISQLILFCWNFLIKTIEKGAGAWWYEENIIRNDQIARTLIKTIHETSIFSWNCKKYKRWNFDKNRQKNDQKSKKLLKNQPKDSKSWQKIYKKKKICENFFSEKCYPKKKLKIFKILVYIGNPIVFSKFKKKTSIFW